MMDAPNGNQRWREGRDSYRPAGELIRTSEYEVVEFRDDATPKAFVIAQHYSASYPAARFRFGLYRRGELVGVAVFSHPCNDRVLAVFPGAAIESVELGRFVLLDEVPGNGETWFLARAFELLRGRVRGVLSFSDPMPRQTAAGLEVFAGHIGTIYQAFNGRYLGRGPRRTLHLLPDGRVFSARTMSKVRKQERGWRYSAGELERFGAAPLAEGDDARAWLATWVPLLTRCVRHPGHHRYVWAIDRRIRPMLPPAVQYPKGLNARAA